MLNVCNVWDQLSGRLNEHCGGNDRLVPASRGLSRRGKMKREERPLPASGEFPIAHACARVSLTTSDHFKWTNKSWECNDLASGRCRGPHQRKAEEANFKANFSFFTSLSTAEAHVFGVKFIGLYGSVGFIAIRDFSF